MASKDKKINHQILCCKVLKCKFFGMLNPYLTLFICLKNNIEVFQRPKKINCQLKQPWMPGRFKGLRGLRYYFFQKITSEIDSAYPKTYVSILHILENSN